MVYHSSVLATQGSFPARLPCRTVLKTFQTNTNIPIAIRYEPIDEVMLYASHNPWSWYV